MTRTADPSVHASAVLIGARAVLIRGASGSGKSELAFRLIEAGRTGTLPFARLISDDRTLLEVRHGRLVARPVPALAGLLEVRGLGLRRLPFECAGVVRLVVDLEDGPVNRMPEAGDQTAEILGVRISRIAASPVDRALRGLSAWLATQSYSAG